jgi:hypothetical protein
MKRYEMCALNRREVSFHEHPEGEYVMAADALELERELTQLRVGFTDQGGEDWKPPLDKMPVARLQVHENNPALFDIVILDRARCRDGMRLYDDAFHRAPAPANYLGRQYRERMNDGSWGQWHYWPEDESLVAMIHASEHQTRDLYAGSAPAPADDRITKLREALRQISETRFGWEGDCGVTRIADDALHADDETAAHQAAPAQPSAAPSGTPQEQFEEALACVLCEHTDISTDGIDEWVPRIIGYLPREVLPFEIAPTEGIDPAFYAAPTSDQQAGAEEPPLPEPAFRDLMGGFPFREAYTADQMLAYRRAAPAAIEQAGAPIPMVLYCPKCHAQHIDAPEWEDDPHDIEHGQMRTWTNPPHRSHLCHACSHIWRPADVPTVGVRATETRGKADSPVDQAGAQPVAQDDLESKTMGEVIAAGIARGRREEAADWAECERIANLPEVDEVLRGFSEDPTGDNGAMVVRAVLESLAAPTPTIEQEGGAA